MNWLKRKIFPLKKPRIEVRGPSDDKIDNFLINSDSEKEEEGMVQYSDEVWQDETAKNQAWFVEGFLKNPLVVQKPRNNFGAISTPRKH